MIPTFKQTSDFGAVDAIRNGVPHTGIDIAMPLSTPLRSVMDGWIAQVLDGTTTLGKGVIIKGLDGKEYIYGHMQSVALKIGDAVKYGDFIGSSGNTGRSSGPHLHFAVRDNGQYVDPSSFKPTLDKLSEEYINAPWLIDGASNGREEMTACLPKDGVNWYDVEGRMNAFVDMKACETKAEIFGFLRGLLDITMELSYGVTLIGGGVLILLHTFEVTRAKKYLGAMFLVYLFLHQMFGGIK